MTDRHLLVIDGVSIVKIRSAAEEIVELYAKLPSKGKNAKGRRPNRKGGFLCIFNNRDGELWAGPEAIGFPAKEEIKQYKLFSKEKGERLFKNLRSTLTYSSFQSRDESKNKFGGAILANNLIVSFSGVTELGDEAICLVLALYFGWMTELNAEIIAHLSNNQCFAQLQKSAKEHLIL
jgi:hypothetical protein